MGKNTPVRDPSSLSNIPLVHENEKTKLLCIINLQRFNILVLEL